jgi:hypothetical protein
LKLLNNGASINVVRGVLFFLRRSTIVDLALLLAAA